ncbi:choice-of-anchor I family protein [Marinobacterium sp. D7]|uniref:choice-of-anchor I family protein n=1 Tax=Marinobacterium ramblicola TaxID=2849041 RepID=UPI001C2CECFD|nr:choice-of-anchor I family protein [Marinobacterium ramblicola]MBV1787483.1 choice-of-anchor I family protein [Marinobacterium ramblicola]
MKPTLLASALSLTLGVALTNTALAGFSVTQTGHFAETCSDTDEGGCTEISDYSHTAQRLYVTNGTDNKLRILALDENGALSAMSEESGVPSEIDLAPYGGGPNSVAVYGDWVAVAIEADNKQQNGKVVVFDLDGNYQRSISVGALPDMLTFTPDGRYLLVANEGEPNDSYTRDPEGSISIIDTQRSWRVRSADFHFSNDANRGVENGVNPAEMAQGKAKGADQLSYEVRLFGPGATAAQDFEPEYIAVSPDSRTAWVSLQENNALAIVDIEKAKVIDVVGLGYKDHMLPSNTLDASNEDAGINLQNWPVLGMYLPDAIAALDADGEVYILSANEGDSRDYDGYSEEARVKDLLLDPAAFAGFDIDELQKKQNLGRLKVTTSQGDEDGDGDFDKLYAYGARSFSVWNSKAERVWDSGNQFETLLAQYAGEGSEVWEDNRSDDKGPEPESIVVGELDGKPYAFIGLERTSGIFIYDLENPKAPKAAGVMDIEELGDLAPEGLKFIANGDSGWLVVTSEVSSTVSVYRVSVVD